MIFSILLTTVQAQTRIFITTPNFENLEDREEEMLYSSFQNAVVDSLSEHHIEGNPVTILSFRDLPSEMDANADFFLDIQAQKEQNDIHAFFTLKDSTNKILLEREFHSNQLFIKDESSRTGWLMMNEYFGANSNADKYKIYDNYLYTAFINSVPNNVMVYKNEKETCTTPCSVSGSQKRLTVKLIATGYKTATHTFDFSEGANVQRDTIVLGPEDGNNYIQSMPSGATVFINGEEKGQTPLFLPLEANTYSLRLEEECSTPKQVQLEIDPDSYKKNKFVLAPQMVAYPLKSVSVPFYTEFWNEYGELVITHNEIGASIPKCTDALIYKDPNGLLRFVPMNKSGEPTSDQSIPYANQLQKPLIHTGQWVELFRFPDPRAIFRVIGIKKFSGENRGEQTPMVLISGGTHRIPFGDYSDNKQASSEVVLNHDFYMFQKEVGQYLYSEVMSKDVAYFQKCGSDCPVEQVSWMDAITFANRLSEKMKLEPCYEINNGIATWTSGYECEGFRLPTEEEWRVAAKTSLYSQSNIYEQAWFGNNSFAKTHASCKAATNEIGICDIFGNVAEWIWDSTQAKTEEEKGLVGGDRYLCGGHAFSHDLSSPSKFCSPERPSTKNMNTGFRLVRTVSRPEQEDIKGGS